MEAKVSSEPLLLKVFLLHNRAKLRDKTYITHAPSEDIECINCNGQYLRFRYITIQKPRSLESVPFDQAKWQDKKNHTSKFTFTHIKLTSVWLFLPSLYQSDPSIGIVLTLIAKGKKRKSTRTEKQVSIDLSTELTSVLFIVKMT